MLNIITACIRPQNLEKIHKSILEAKANYGSELPLRWYIILDARAATQYLFLAKMLETKALSFQPEFETHIIENDSYKTKWETPINIGLSQIKEGLVCAVDDDNIMHPFFIKCIYPHYLNGKKGFIFHQLLHIDKSYNQRVRFAKPIKIGPGKIDTAQFCFDRSIIGDISWSPKVKEPDGVFISLIYAKHHEAILIIEEILCYYNYLSPKFSKV